MSASARRSAYFVVSLVIFRSVGMDEPTPNTSTSRNGTRSSSELAIVILSALTRMSPRSQVNRSTYCIRVEPSRWVVAAYSGLVTSM